MCLDIVDKKIDRKKLKREGKYVICWKVVRRIIWAYWAPEFQSLIFKPGWNVSTRRSPIWVDDDTQYVPHFHAFCNRQAASKWSCTFGHVVRCKTYLKYITATGRQAGNCLVTSKIWIPPYPGTK